MYRVTTWDDLYSTGFFDYEGTGIMVIEWSENISEYLPQEKITISIERISDNEREITIEGAQEI